jgi:hypothetical protein
MDSYSHGRQTNNQALSLSFILSFWLQSAVQESDTS